MSEYKPGEVVEGLHVQKDSAGNIISEVSVKWYGFENAEANELTMQLVKAVVGVADAVAAQKAGKGKPVAR